MAQALVHEPRVLVVDEPTVGLDPEERIRFRQLMSALGRDRTILISTHIVADLGAGCRELAILDAGRIVFQGPPSRLLGLAAGQVFEVTVSMADAEAIESRYEIVSSTVSAGQVTLRGVAEGEQRPAAAAAVAEPNLEESYLAFMAARGRTSAARQDETGGGGVMRLSMILAVTPFPWSALYGAMQAALFYLVLSMAMATLFRSEAAGAMSIAAILGFNGLISGFGENQVRVSPFWNPYALENADPTELFAWTLQNRIGIVLAMAAILELAFMRANRREQMLGA